MFLHILHGLFGLTMLMAIAWALSENKKIVDLRTIAGGLCLQFVIALMFIKIPLFKGIFIGLNRATDALSGATRAGTSFVFGYLGGGSLPFAETIPGGSFILATQSLPLILVISALSAVLFYWRILPFVVSLFSRVLQRTMGIGGALGVGTAVNIFVGMVSAPLIIKPYLQGMTRSELFALMTSGMATIAGTVLVLYATFIQKVIPDAIGHILTASIISVPASILIARLMVPETETRYSTRKTWVPDQTAKNTMDAIASGTAEGVQVFIQVTAMLIVLVALVSLANEILSILPVIQREPITLERILGTIMAPVVWLIGIPWSEAATAGQLMGVKMVLNELLAYLKLAGLPQGALSERSAIIMTYAMCGFANFGSLGIMVGGLGAMIPERRREVAELGLRSIVSGTLATCMTGAMVGMLI
ncbi:NupC/NupG family nucleoside CNT transporter [Desulfoplanes sp.]